MSALGPVIEDLAALSNDPLRFVLYAFPWGEAGTELEHMHGPEPWQTELLAAIRDGLLSPEVAIQHATRSGHGVGKSALVAWLILWSISTFEDTTGVVTANTETQLKTKTWAQLGKWFRLFIGRDLFDLTATAIISRDPDHVRTWRIDMVPWSERNTEAFAGLHNQGKRILVVFDEASSIPDTIWEVTEGALTDSNTQIIWAVFGNPTRNTGRFNEAFPGGRHGHRWKSHEVDSRSVSFTNKEQIQKWIDDYGEDSDFVRVRVLGRAPRAGSLQFIPSDLAVGASIREPLASLDDPFIIGVDVARFGDDDSVIYFRKGLDGRTHPPVRLRPSDSQSAWTMILAGKVSEYALAYRADAVFVDGGGIGAGVVDRLRQLHCPVWDIQFGGKADRPALEGNDARYANKRAEMWGFMRDWLRQGAVPDDPDLLAQLVGPEYGFNARNEIQLEKKEDMKRRGLASPDIGDALALTFAYAVAPSVFAGRLGANERSMVEFEYNPFDEKALAA